jgi:hypothetical protein
VSDQKKAEELISRLARGGRAATRADELVERLTASKEPRRETEKARKESRLVDETGRTPGPQTGDRTRRR